MSYMLSSRRVGFALISHATQGDLPGRLWQSSSAACAPSFQIWVLSDGLTRRPKVPRTIDASHGPYGPWDGPWESAWELTLHDGTCVTSNHVEYFT